MNAMKIYQINEIFYSLQGEGFYAGQASVFVRFAHCNLQCPFCDTEFQTIAYSFNKLELESFVLALLEKEQVASKPNIIFTGGEPTLQLCENEPLFDGFYRCIETNGYKIAPSWIEWVTFSPKHKPIVPEKLQRANEVKILYSLLVTKNSICLQMRIQTSIFLSKQSIGIARLIMILSSHFAKNIRVFV